MNVESIVDRVTGLYAAARLYSDRGSALETVLSTPLKIDFLARARERGYFARGTVYDGPALGSSARGAPPQLPPRSARAAHPGRPLYGPQAV